ncbi:MAG TPA: hypothetical protein V6C86_24205 [Oculatellaceae cyanobacterium]
MAGEYKYDWRKGCYVDTMGVPVTEPFKTELQKQAVLSKQAETIWSRLAEVVEKEGSLSGVDSILFALGQLSEKEMRDVRSWINRRLNDKEVKRQDRLNVVYSVMAGDQKAFATPTEALAFAQAEATKRPGTFFYVSESMKRVKASAPKVDIEII